MSATSREADRRGSTEPRDVALAGFSAPIACRRYRDPRGARGLLCARGSTHSRARRERSVCFVAIWRRSSRRGSFLSAAAWSRGREDSPGTHADYLAFVGVGGAPAVALGARAGGVRPVGPGLAGGDDCVEPAWPLRRAESAGSWAAPGKSGQWWPWAASM